MLLIVSYAPPDTEESAGWSSFSARWNSLVQPKPVGSLVEDPNWDPEGETVLYGWGALDCEPGEVAHSPGPHVVVEVLDEPVIRLDWPRTGAYKFSSGVILHMGTLEEVLHYLGWHTVHPQWALMYAYQVVKGRWPEGEEVIRTGAEWAFWYARDMLQGRWLEAEEVIKADPQWAKTYLSDIVKGPWPEAEDVIKTDPDLAYYYATLILERPWPEGEDAIRSNSKLARSYNDYVRAFERESQRGTLLPDGRPVASAILDLERGIQEILARLGDPVE